MAYAGSTTGIASHRRATRRRKPQRSPYSPRTQARARKHLKRATKAVRQQRTHERKVTLPRLTKTIQTLEARRSRLARPTTRVSTLTGPNLEIQRVNRLAQTEARLARARARHASIMGDIATRRGRKAPPITPLEVGEAVIGAIPGGRAAIPGVKGAIALSKALASRGGAKAPAATRGASGVARAESRAAARAAGQKVKPVSRGTRGQRRPFSARRRAQTKARRQRAPGEYRSRTRVPRTKLELRARTGRQYRKRKPDVLFKEGRQVKRRRRIENITYASSVDPIAPAIVAGGAAASGAAFLDDPMKTIKTTARTVPAIATAAASIPIDVGASIVQGSPKPLEGQVNQQLDYWKLVSGMVSGKGADITDPRTGETVHRTPEQIVQEDVGLIPALSAGITGAALGRRAGVKGPASVRERNIARLEGKTRSPDRATRMRARKKMTEMRQTPRERHAENTREAKRSAATGERIEKQFEREFGGAKKGGLMRRLEAMNQEPLTDKVTVADTLQFLGRTGLYGTKPAQLRREVAAHRKTLAAPKRDIHPDDVATRDVLDALEQHPDVASDPTVVSFLRDYGDPDDLTAMQTARSVERHAQRTERPQTTPDPDDARARLFHVARALGIAAPEEMPLHELRGLVPEAALGVEARTAARTAASGARRTATRSTRRAQMEETRARGAARELNVRRIADDRRSQFRSLDRGLRRLEQRRTAWATKARSAKTANLRLAAEAKIRYLDNQIRARRARLALSASPARLAAVRRVTEHRGRARVLREEATRERFRAQQIESVAGRESRATGLERQATRHEADGELAAAAELRAEATALRKRAVEAKRAVDREFTEKTRGALRDRGLSEPIYFRELDVTDEGALNVMGDYPGSQLPKAEQRRMGQLAKQGRIDEAGATLLESAYRGRVAIEMRKHGKEFFDEALMRDKNGKPIIKDGAAWREDAPNLPPGTALVPVQEFNRLFKSGAWDEAAGLIDNAITTSVREARLQGRKKYGALSRAKLEQFRDQMTPYSRGLKALRTSARIQSASLLALSPAWFGYQLLASPLAAFVHHPNPARWAKATDQYLREWRDLPDQEKIDFQSQYGSTSADAVAMMNAQIGLRPDTVRNSHSAAGVGLRSPVGRLMNSITTHARKGGPLIAANRRYEGEIRDLVALMELDKHIKNPERVLRFADSVGRSHKQVADELAQLKGKSLREQIAYVNTHPEVRNSIVDGIDNAVGNWNALTKAERKAAAVTVFYPFLRFSLRWMFVSMPKQRPNTMAILMNLAQANAEELEQLLGGAPSFFPEWGNVVTHISEDKPVAIDLGRIAPGSNAIIEAFGQSGLNLQSVARPLQPAFATILTALAGQDPLSGRESDLSKAEIILKGIVGLPTPLRAEANKIGPEPSVYSQLFRKISGRERNLAYYALPQVFADLNRETEAVKASELLDKAFGDNDPQARIELEQMLNEYGLEAADNLSSLGSDSSSSSSSSSGGIGQYLDGSSSSSSSSGVAKWLD